MKKLIAIITLTLLIGCTSSNNVKTAEQVTEPGQYETTAQEKINKKTAKEVGSALLQGGSLLKGILILIN